MRPLKGRVHLGAVVVLAGIVGACNSDPAAAAKGHVFRGDRALASGHPRDALIEYKAAVQADPQNGDARLKLGEVALSVGDSKTAADQFVRAADLIPSSFEAQLRAGQLLLASARYEDARTRADKAIALKPSNADALILRGNALAGLKDLNAAVEQVEEAIKLDPQETAGYTDLGALQLIRGDKEGAEAAFIKAVTVSPKSVLAHMALANFYWAVGKRGQVETPLKEALALDPKNVNVNRSLAYFYLALNRLEEAEEPLKLVADETKDVTSEVVLADYYQASGRQSQAMQILDQLAVDPKTRSLAQSRKAALLYSAGRKVEAYSVLDEALKKQSKDETVLLQRANLLFADGRTDEALQMAEAARTAAPTSAAPPFAVARIQAARFNWDDAIGGYLAALQKSPNLIQAQIGLATAYFEAGRPVDALHASENILATQPGNPLALVTKTRALISMGDVVGVEESLKDMPAAVRNTAVVHSQVGLLAILKHDNTGARLAFQAALKLDPNNLSALQGLSQLDFLEKRGVEARARIDDVVAKPSPPSPTLVLAAQIHSSMSDRPGAEKLLQRAIDTDPLNLRAYMLLGELYASERRIDEAIAQIDHLSSRKTSAVTADTMIGMLLEMQHKQDQAKHWYELALNASPKAGVAANNLAMIYVNSGGNLDIALKLAQTARAQLPNTPEVSDTLGLVYYRKGLTPLAIGAFQESVAKDPKNAGYAAHLGLAYAKAGDSEKATKSLRRAFSLGEGFPDAAEAKATLAALSGSKG